MNNKTLIYGVVVVVVIAILVFITINSKEREDSSLVVGDDIYLNENMENEQNENVELGEGEEQQAVSGKGVKITILKEGTGAGVESGNVVSVNYTGMLENGTVFDSNVDPKFQHVEPFNFPLGAGQVIRGWDEGVVGMKVGEKRKLEISPDYAYGSTGIGNVIPPNATLIFEVELLAIKQ